MKNKYKEDKDNPGVYVPSDTLPEEDLNWKEAEIKLYSKVSNSPAFAKGLKKANGLNNSKEKASDSEEQLEAPEK